MCAPTKGPAGISVRVVRPAELDSAFVCVAVAEATEDQVGRWDERHCRHLYLYCIGVVGGASPSHQHIAGTEPGGFLRRQSFDDQSLWGVGIAGQSFFDDYLSEAVRTGNEADLDFGSDLQGGHFVPADADHLGVERFDLEIGRSLEPRHVGSSRIIVSGERATAEEQQGDGEQLRGQQRQSGLHLVLLLGFVPLLSGTVWFLLTLLTLLIAYNFFN